MNTSLYSALISAAARTWQSAASQTQRPRPQAWCAVWWAWITVLARLADMTRAT
ncbi:PagK family vesicle-borne virulence factor [Rugamonas sp. DEMB1]|uniref:PagK family vesicle-borne virulence factor n=1 Tax=Rugamonas sp. DEMB1 TaxID=3039386 RepID=UPI00391D133A